MLMEIMGLHLPGTAFVQPGSELRDALTRAAAMRVTALADGSRGALADVIDERAIVNGVVGLMASGGSTNHALHLPAIARAAGIQLRDLERDAVARAHLSERRSGREPFPRSRRNGLSDPRIAGCRIAA